MTERFGDWQTMASGRTVWPLDPRPEEIDIEDIAHHLARINRWGGATRDPYSVAQHSVMLALYFELGDQRPLTKWALLHDAAEAYLGDVVRPLKPFIPAYRRFEAQLERVIWTKFGLIGELPEAVKAADTAILGDERDQLFKTNAHARLKRPGETGLGTKLCPWSPSRAEEAFLTAFRIVFPGMA